MQAEKQVDLPVVLAAESADPAAVLEQSREPGQARLPQIAIQSWRVRADRRDSVPAW